MNKTDKEMTEIKSVEDLEKTLIRWSGKQLHRPDICRNFDEALIHLVTFVLLTLQSYSKYAGVSNLNTSKQNEELRKKDNSVQIFNILSDIISSYIIPELYSFSLVGGWGLLEEFLHDVPFWTITNNLKLTKPARHARVKKSEIDTNKLAAFTLESGKRNINELLKIYKNILGIDLKSNEHFITLLKLRQRRNKIAHTGKLLGYNSITDKLFTNNDDFEKELFSIQRRAGEEFTKTKTTYNEKNHPILHITSQEFDPIQTITSKELEQDFCSTIVHMWKLCDFLTEKLFRETKTL